MPDYRRNRVPGGTFFFTANLLDHRSNLLVIQSDALRDAVRQVRDGAPFLIDAWVVLPDHMHCLWTLPEGDADFPGRWRAIKKGKLKGSRQRAELFLTSVVPMDLADDIQNGALLVDADGPGSADALAHRRAQPAGNSLSPERPA